MRCELTNFQMLQIQTSKCNASKLTTTYKINQNKLGRGGGECVEGAPKLGGDARRGRCSSNKCVRDNNKNCTENT